MKVKKEPFLALFAVFVAVVPVAGFFILAIADDSLTLKGALALGCLAVCLAVICVLFVIASHTGHGFDFEDSGVTEYCPFWIVKHHEWSDFKTCCIITHRGRPRDFLFSFEPLPDDSKRLYAARGRQGSILNSFTDILVPYSRVRYEEFCKNCPSVELPFVEFE